MTGGKTDDGDHDLPPDDTNNIDDDSHDPTPAVADDTADDGRDPTAAVADDIDELDDDDPTPDIADDLDDLDDDGPDPTPDADDTDGAAENTPDIADGPVLPEAQVHKPVPPMVSRPPLAPKRTESPGAPSSVTRDDASATGDGDDVESARLLNFRSSDDRNRSVYRLANPWYRQLARFTIAACIFAALGIGAFLIARVIQDFVQRDKLPSAGEETPDIRQSSFLIRADRVLDLDGTLTFDVSSHAFEFVGRVGGPNAGDWLTSPDGGTVYARAGSTTWRRLPDDHPLANDARLAMQALSRNDNADTILSSEMRRGFVELDELIEEGSGDIARNRYDVTLELERFADRFPLQWNRFRSDAIPGASADEVHRLSFWIDTDNVLVRLEDDAAGWEWERLTYSDRRFEPTEPAPDEIVEPGAGEVALTTCTIADSDLDFATALDTCEQARLIGRQFAVATGVVGGDADPDTGDADPDTGDTDTGDTDTGDTDTGDTDTGDTDAAAEAAFTGVCTVIQGSATETDLDDESFEALAVLLSDSGVCPGDPDLVRPSP